jgi:ArsR family transcriptional regulator
MDDIINLLNMLADKTRLRIMMLLRGHELCVCEIFAALKMSQPRVSRQLAVLRQAGLIRDRREGKWVYYRIEDRSKDLGQILELLTKWLENDSEIKCDKELLTRIFAIKKDLLSCACAASGGEIYEK